jgi:hypothetical protein
VTAVACMNASGSNWIPSDSEIGKLENEIVWSSSSSRKCV